MIDLRRVQQGHRRFLNRFHSALALELEAAKQRGEREAERNPGFTPRSGSDGLAASTKAKVVRIRRGAVVILSNAKPHAAPIDKGSKAHTITAKNGPYLHFRGSRGWARKKSVNHPGNKPYRFLRRATESAAQQFGRRMRLVMRRLAPTF